MLLLQVVTVFLVGVAMSLALAHALEFPGKMRLSKESYLATQSIYYPGFTIGGFGEALAVIATLALTISMPRGTAAFWWAFSGFVAMLIMHGIFWTVTQRANRQWVAGLPLTGAAQRFFFLGSRPSERRRQDWEWWRNIWEYSHIVRSVFAAIGLISITVAIALHGGR